MRRMFLFLSLVMATAFLRAEDEWVADNPLLLGEKTLTRFPPGVTRQSGWVDITKQGNLTLPSGEQIND